MRSHVAGRAEASPGPSEIRRAVERAAANRDPAVLLDDAWLQVEAIYGATHADPTIDVDKTIAAARRAVRRIVDVAGTGAHIALATSRPASLITMYLALARLARISGGDVIDGDDSGPLRIDGRSAREIRWVDGVAMVTDRESLCTTRGMDAPLEWLFLVPRPALVVADGPYADAAIDAGIEVVAPAGLEHASLAVGRRRGSECMCVPMWTDRPPGAYRPLIEAALAAAVEPPEPSANGDGG